MKMRNSEIITKTAALADIISRKEQYPVKFSFALSKNARILETAGRDFEEARNRLLDQYNRKEADGRPAYLSSGKIEILPEYEEVWRKDAGELLEIGVELPVHTVPASVLDGIQIAADILYVCDFMFEQ